MQHNYTVMLNNSFMGYEHEMFQNRLNIRGTEQQRVLKNGTLKDCIKNGARLSCKW